MRKRGAAWHTVESFRLDLRGLRRDGLVERGQALAGEIRWSRDGSLTGSADLFTRWQPGEESYLSISYAVTRGDGTREGYRQRIRLVTLPANIGKGEVPYMECPRTGRRCRILYRAYGERGFMSREAYLELGLRLYYPSQAASKLHRLNQRYMDLSRKLEREEQLREPLLYAGKPTKRMLRRAKLQQRVRQADDERMEFFCAWVERRADIFK
jgi:hypothetical protein